MISGLNGSGSDVDEDAEGNVVSFPSKHERQKAAKEKQREERAHQKSLKEPMFNLPPVTQTLIGVIAIWYLLLEGIGFYDPNLRYALYEYLGFIPGAFTGQVTFQFYHLLGVVFYIFLHGSWLHFLMNALMLTAFGAGVERMVGARHMLEVFFISSLAGIAAHFLFYMTSTEPVIGASGGISGIFGAAVVYLHARGMLGRSKYGIWPFIILWVGISVLFGLFGSGFTGGATVAWIAHLGGFFAGIVMAKRRI